jgi:hypothetical protein
MTPRHLLRLTAIAFFLVLPGLSACEEKPKLLGITGYNYTSRYIDTFSVNGQGGTNLSANSNGAGEACCIGFRPGQALPLPVHVEWTYGAKWNFDKGVKLKDAETHSADVQLKGPTPKDPKIFVVHFYPDNTVQVEVADDYPTPRLQPSVAKVKAP